MAVGWRVWCGRAEMSSIMEQQRRVSQGGGRAKKTEFRCLKLLLLLIYFINYSGSATAGNSPQRVTGEEGDSVTLPCEFQPRDDSRIVLNSQSKKILDCQNGECTTENGRVFKKGSCDIIITHLIFSDAGKYILKVHNADGQIEVERKFHLHIQGEISVETGEQLKMDVLLINADKVEKNSSGEWTEVWTRGHGVSSDRLTDRDGNLTISNFTVSDTGTYRVLDSEGEIWITVTVTEFSKGLVGKIDTDKTEQHKSWIIVVCVSVTLLVLISALIWKRKRQHKNTEHEAVPMEDTVQ